MKRQSKWDKREGAIKSEMTMNAIEGAIYRLRDRAIGHKRIELSHDALKDLLIKQEHFRTAHEAVSIMGFAASDKIGLNWTVEGRELALQIYLRGNRDFRFPNYSGQQYTNAGAPAASVIGHWCLWRIKRGQEWGLVYEVLDTLDQQLESIEQIRFYWPAIVPLLASNDQTRHLAEQIRDFKVPKKLPTISAGLRAACQDANDTVARGLMLPADVPDDDSPVRMALNTQGMRTEFLPWTTRRGRLL